eukprot:4480350-Pyramimonas_sp.AAC.1
MRCMTHSPKRPDCEICSRTTAQNAPCRRQRKPHPPAAPTDEDTAHGAFVPKMFGEALTADHVVLAKDDAADKHGDKYALVALDRYTGIFTAYPAMHKDAATTKASFQQFIAANDAVKHIYIDNSGELPKACRQLGWGHATSTPHRPQTNGMIERIVKIVILGTRAVLHLSGLGHEW